MLPRLFCWTQASPVLQHQALERAAELSPQGEVGRWKMMKISHLQRFQMDQVDKLILVTYVFFKSHFYVWIFVCQNITLRVCGDFKSGGGWTHFNPWRLALFYSRVSFFSKNWFVPSFHDYSTFTSRKGRLEGVLSRCAFFGIRDTKFKRKIGCGHTGSCAH